jgi:hypothetical protein
MTKYICLAGGLKEESYNDFRNRILTLGRGLLLDPGVKSLKLTLTEELPPAISVIPFKKKKVTAISITTESGTLPEKMKKAEGLIGCYRVTEAIPVGYTKAWPDGEKTPGICLLTLFKQKPGMAYDKFLDRWFNSHTPLSLKIHPLWNYNRNVVNEILNENAMKWDGIVEEHFRTEPDLLNPFKFFGNPLIVLYRMMEVYRDTNAFLDYKTIEPYFAREYILRG